MTSFAGVNFAGFGHDL